MRDSAHLRQSLDDKLHSLNVINSDSLSAGIALGDERRMAHPQEPILELTKVHYILSLGSLGCLRSLGSGCGIYVNEFHQSRLCLREMLAGVGQCPLRPQSAPEARELRPAWVPGCWLYIRTARQQRNSSAGALLSSKIVP